MGRLRSRLERLEASLEGETVALVCPACRERFVVGADTGLDYLAWCWAQDYQGETYGETPADVLRVADHPHDASLFVLEADGSPWLGEFFRGIEQEPRDAEDLSE